MSLDGQALAERIAELADDKKGDRIQIFNMEGISILADYYVLVSGQTTVKTKAIASHIEDELEKQGEKTYGKEGQSEGTWLLLDYGNVIVHVMREPEREHYMLERLWAHAPNHLYVSPEADKAESTPA